MSNNDIPGDPGLPPGATSRDIDGPETIECDCCGNRVHYDADECPHCGIALNDGPWSACTVREAV